MNLIVDLVDVAPLKTRVSVLQYSGYTRMEFDFQAYANKTMLREGIATIKHMYGGTRTGKALIKSATMLQDPQYGSRKGWPGVAQVSLSSSEDQSQRLQPRITTSY